MNDEKFNWVPVVSSSGKPLMPCHPARARDLIRKGKAVPKWKKQLYYIQLVDRVDGDLQPVACGIDPGSKREGYTVKSATKTYLNINSHACGYVKDKVSFKRVMRKLRRSRHTPCRAKRSNRSRSLNFIPPSTRARWGLKLRISAWLSKFYPISAFVVEDIIYETIEGKNIRSNSSFSPLQVGKKWFYEQLSKLANVFTKVGRDTYNLRRDHGLIKTRLKMAEDFSAHCVDSWVLANWHTGGHLKPDNQTLMILKPIDYRRRQLHVATPVKGGCRRRYGGTMSLGVKRGTLVIHNKHGLSMVGGYTEDRVTLTDTVYGKRKTQQAKLSDCLILAPSPWLYHPVRHSKSIDKKIRNVSILRAKKGRVVVASETTTSL